MTAPTLEAPINVFDALDKQAEDESVSSPIVCQFRFEAGYKIFITGVGNRESFFSYTPGNEKSQATALELAKSANEKNGGEKAPSAAAQIIAYKNSVKGKNVTWKDDRFFTYPIWTPAYKQVVKPAFVKVGVNAIGEYWGKIAFVKDPSGRKKSDGKTEEVAYIAELYTDEAAALKAAGPVNGTNGHVSTPQGYTTETWAKQESDIRALRLSYIQKGMDATASTAKAAQDYGATVEQVCVLLGITADVIPL